MENTITKVALDTHKKQHAVAWVNCETGQVEVSTVKNNGKDIKKLVKKLKKAKQRLDSSSGSADDELLGLLASGYSTAKRGFTRRYLAEVMRSCRGDLRAAANATGLPLPRLIGLLDHLDVR